MSLTYNGDAQLDLKHRAMAFGSLAASVVFGALCIQFVCPHRSQRTPPDSGTRTPSDSALPLPFVTVLHVASAR